jgi:hypothetical protein
VVGVRGAARRPGGAAETDTAMADRPARRPRRWGGLAVAVAVALLAQLPVLRNPAFYYWDDSANEYLPQWYRIGEQLRAGHWAVLDPTMWMGGNHAAWMMMGLFNPVSLANDLLVAALPDLALAATLVKTEYLVLLAVGIYLLAGEYGAGRAAAGAVAVALPLAGYTLYYDASSWAAGLAAFAWLPLVWWSLRRYARGAAPPIVPVLLGFLAMTTGNPYGALGVIVVLVAVGVEHALRTGVRALAGLAVVAVAIGLTGVVVYLPLAASAAVTWRSGLGVGNDGLLVPHLSDLLGMSAPTYQPQYPVFGTRGGPIGTPAMYLAWFALPLAPWLPWSVLRRRARELAGLAVFGGIYLVLLVGPSSVWLFRWPARLIEYLALPLGVALAVLLTAGLRTDRPRRRAALSVLVVLAGGYLSWASVPAAPGRHAAAVVLVLVLLAAALLVARYRPRYLAAVLVAGTAACLGLQVAAYPANPNLVSWRYPHDLAAMRADFAGYRGNTLQVGDESALAAVAPMTPDGAFRELLLGNGVHAAGVAALNSYSGIGYRAFSRALCMNYDGGTCADAYQRLWRTVPGTTADLADLLRLRTVVLLNGYTDRQPADPDRFIDRHTASVVDPTAPPVDPPPGWAVVQRRPLVSVLGRRGDLPFPDGRLSWAGTGLRVTADRTEGATAERVGYTGGGTAVFAALAWPGWRAAVDGRPVPVRQGPAGLVAVDLPPSAAGGSTLALSFQPPGFAVGIPLLVAGLLLGAAHTVARRLGGPGSAWAAGRARRRRRRAG